MGAHVILVEETPWLGGMMSAAGVSAFDIGSLRHATGIFLEVERALTSYYGGPADVKINWVSDVSFEPHVGNEILQTIARREKKLQILFRARLVRVLWEGSRAVGAVIENLEDHGTTEVRAAVTIDATEQGEVLALAGVPFRVGRESRAETGEPDAPETPDDLVQDPTYVAILREYPTRQVPAFPPPRYDPADFRCSTTMDCPPEHLKRHRTFSLQQFLTYCKLQHAKILINWPIHGNDFHSNPLHLDPAGYTRFLAEAKAKTLRFVYYIQTTLGQDHLNLADHEFPTEDRMPLIPYYRESRRLVGVKTMREQEVMPEAATGRAPLAPDSLAIGDYPIDHHHSSAEGEPVEIDPSYGADAPFEIPVGVSVPRMTDGLLAAEKNVSVTHLVNGCTRLQPVVMLIGQGVGAMAALAARQHIAPRAVDFREVQAALIDSGDALFPYEDVQAETQGFASIERLALCGFLPEKGYAFQPAALISAAESRRWLDRIVEKGISLRGLDKILPESRAQTVPGENVRRWLHSQGIALPGFSCARTESRRPCLGGVCATGGKLTRAEFAIVLDRVFDPFHDPRFR